MAVTSSNTTNTSPSSPTRIAGGWVNKMRWLKRASFYPAEYVLMLSSSLGLIFAVSFLGAAVIGDWLDQPLVALVSPGVMYLVASVIVTLPVHLAFYWRVRHTDRATLSQTALRVSHAALGVYLFIIVSVLVTLATWLVYAWLNVAYGVSDYNDSLLAVTLSLLHAIVWLKYSAWHFVRARGARSRPRNYAVVVGLASVVLVVLGLVFPGQAGLTAARDSIKEADLSQIEFSINDYVTQNNELPSSLSALNLSGDIKDRLGDYDYSPQGEDLTYEICATFSGSSDDAAFSFSSYKHGAGRECFTRQAYGVSSNSFDFNSLNLDSDSSSDELDDSLQQYLDSGSLDSL